MSASELAAFRAGLRHAADIALIAAMELELRDDAGKLRQRAAIEALRGLAEGLKAEASPPALVDSSADAACPSRCISVVVSAGGVPSWRFAVLMDHCRIRV